MNPQARDKVQRAYALSTAADLRPIRAISAAWLAHLEYARLSMDSMVNYCRAAIDTILPEDTAAISRVCLTIGQSIHFAGRPELARPWYNRVRQVAISEGDDATLGALSHNMAWLSMSELRQATFTKAAKSVSQGRAQVGIDSLRSISAITGATSFAHLVPVLQAQVLSLTGHAREAVSVYESISSISDLEGIGRFEANLIADLAWCHARLGQLDLAERYAMTASSSLRVDNQIDDVAAAYSSLAEVYQMLGNSERADELSSLGRTAWQSLISVQEGIVEVLSEWRIP
jgi:tetratricopeptide (TPR) repeat protein